MVAATVSSLSVMGLGFGTVFVGLVCLIFITKLMSLIVRSRKQNEKAAAPAAPVAPAAAPAEAIPDRGAFVSAVAACVATYMGKDVNGLRIHSIKKVH